MFGNRISAEARRRIKDVKLLIMDVDGVLTNGYIVLGDDPGELKIFDVQDGLGLMLWKKAGLKSAIITAGNTKAVERRADSLKIDKVYQGSINKIEAYNHLKKEFEVNDNQICFIGDDLIDIPILKKAGFACCVLNASKDIYSYAHYVSKAEGGRGAVREIIELILKEQNLWNGVIEEFIGVKSAG